MVNGEWYKAYREELTPGLKAVCNWVLKGGEVPTHGKKQPYLLFQRREKIN